MIPAKKSGGDFVDRVRREWSATFADLDTSPIEILARIGRIASMSNHAFEAALVPEGVSRAEFDVLSAIRRARRPLRASEVTSVTSMSGASTTKIADRLVRDGLLERSKLPRDARVVLLQLTDTGRELVDRAFPVRVELDRELLRGLSEDQMRVLADLLRTVALEAER